MEYGSTINICYLGDFSCKQVTLTRFCIDNLSLKCLLCCIWSFVGTTTGLDFFYTKEQLQQVNCHKGQRNPISPKEISVLCFIVKMTITVN